MDSTPQVPQLPQVSAADGAHLPLVARERALVPPDRRVVAACRGGTRSWRAAEVVSAAGLDVRNLEGGMRAWALAGLPVVRPDGTRGEVV